MGTTREKVLKSLGASMAPSTRSFPLLLPNENPSLTNSVILESTFVNFIWVALILVFVILKSMLLTPTAEVRELRRERDSVFPPWEGSSQTQAP